MMTLTKKYEYEKVRNGIILRLPAGIKIDITGGFSPWI